MYTVIANYHILEQLHYVLSRLDLIIFFRERLALLAYFSQAY